MVERPIKKSERQAASPSDVKEEVQETEPSSVEGSQGSISHSSEERNTTRPVQRKDKTNKKGKGNQQESEPSRQANPALMRGPKPTKSKPPVIKIQEPTTEDSIDEDQETPAEE